MRSPVVAHIRVSDGEPQYLHEHLFNVAGLAREFAEKVRCPLAGELEGLSHDFGKYSAQFFAYLNSAAGLLQPDADDYIDPVAKKGRIDHSTAGAQLVWRRLSRGDPRATAVAQIIALNIASHHSGMIDNIAVREGRPAEDNFRKRMNKADDETHLAEVQRSADAVVLHRFDQLVETSGLIDEVFTLLQRIATQNPTRVPRYLQFGLAARFLFSCLIDADRIDSADFEHGRARSVRPMGTYVPWPLLTERLERFLAALPSGIEAGSINEHRQAISESCRVAAHEKTAGVFTLTVPTGGGKTLASLRFALHQAEQRMLDRIVYIVPYTSIIDQNAFVAREVLEPDDAPADKGKVVLEHHSNLTPEQQTWREKLLTEDWDAPVVFTTMVQFLEALFAGGTRGARRMHQLANAVLVFDEVQALPVRCVHLFNNAINFLVEQCNSTVLFCTATQPLLDRVAEDRGAIRLTSGSELMPNVAGLFANLQRVRVHYGRKERTHAQIARLAARQMRREGSCLVIVNTKQSARELYRLCSDLVPGDALFHLSTDMCPAHRARSLGLKGSGAARGETILGRLEDGLPTLCISTQLIEAGIDVDFGSVIRFLAGIDSIAQAAGRGNRHARRRDRLGKPLRSPVFVVRPDRENLERLDEIRKAQEAGRRVFDEFNADPARFDYDIIGPEAIRLYYTYYFFERKEDMVYKLETSRAKNLGRSSETLLNLLSTNAAAVDDLGPRSEPLFLRQSFMAAGSFFEAIDAPTEGVVVPFGTEGARLIEELLDSDHDPNLQHELVRRAQRYTVNVYPDAIQKLRNAGAVRDVSATTRIHLLVDDRYYSPQVGLTTEPDDEWRLQSWVVG